MMCTEIQGKALGMKVEVFDASGNNIEHTGEPGEMVCTRPHISLPVSFWGDDSGEKFRKAYFDHFPGKSADPLESGVVLRLYC
jgi:acetoacetyl-CoA synthetase